MQHGAHRHVAGAQQRQRRQHVGMVVRALHAQGVGRHHAVEDEFHRFGLLPAPSARGHFLDNGLGQPGQAAFTHQTEGRRGVRCVQ